MGSNLIESSKFTPEVQLVKDNLTIFCDALARSIELRYRSDTKDPTLLRDPQYKCAITNDGRNISDLRKQSDMAVESLKSAYPGSEIPLLFIQSTVQSASSLISLIHTFKNIESFMWAGTQEEATKKSIGKMSNPLNEYFLLGIVTARTYDNSWIQTLVNTPDLFTLDERREFLLDEIGVQGKSLTTELKNSGISLDMIDKMSIDELVTRIVWSTLSMSEMDQKTLPKSEVR